MILATQCASSLLQGLEGVARGRGFGLETARAVLRAFPSLTDADYDGPSTYDGTAKQ